MTERQTPIRVRPWQPAHDFEAVFPLVREITSLMPEAEVRAELKAWPNRQAVSLVAEDPAAAGSPILGFCAASYPYWNAVGIIEYLVVAGDRRRCGIGERLVRATEERLRREGMRRVCLQTIDWNKSGLRFYGKLGYRELTRMAGYFDDAHEMVWLDREL